MVTLRGEEPLPSGRITPSHYRSIHRHLFQDVYAWSGRYRRVRLAKGGNMFCYPENIARETSRVFRGLRQGGLLRHRAAHAFAADAAHFLADLNAIHPFREGNGRAQLTLLDILASDAGRPLDLGRLERAPFLEAMIVSFGGDEAPLARQIFRLVGGEAQPRRSRQR